MTAAAPAVRLRPMREADVASLVAWGEDAAFCAAAEWRQRPPEARRAFWMRQLAEPPAGLVRLAAEAEGAFVGYADLHRDGGEAEPGRRELGFLVGPAHQGRGIGTAIARAALEHGFGRLGLERIWAEAWATNAASMRILGRLMRRTGDGEAGTYLGAPTRYARFETDRARWLRGDA